MTVLELLTAAMHRLGYLEAIETPSDADVDAVKQAANDLIDAFRLDNLLVYRIRRHVFDRAASTASYTIGTGGTFNVPRPVWIDRAGVILDPSATTPRERPIQVLTLQDYALLRTKSVESVAPSAVYYDPTVTGALGTVLVHPVPSSATPDLVLYLPEQIAEFGDNDVEIEFATGYRRLLVTHIALEAAPILGVEPTPALVAQAAEAKADVQRANLFPDELLIPLRTPGMGMVVGYDIEQG